MEYIQISDIIFQVKNNTENLAKTSAILLIDGKQTIINVYKTECNNIYLYKGIIQGFPYCRLLTEKDYKIYKTKKSYINKPSIIIKSYGYKTNDSVEKRKNIIEFIRKYKLLEKNILQRELLIFGKGDERFIR